MLVDSTIPTREMLDLPTRRGVENIGGVRGYFENVEICCGMGFDRALSDKAVEELRKRDGDQRNKQLVAISYL